MPSKKPRVALTLDEALHAELKAIAEAENRPLANLLETWIVQALATYREGKRGS